MGATKASLCEVNVRSSRYHLVLMLICHGAACIALWLCSVWPVVKFALAMVLALHFYRRYLQFIAQSLPTSISVIRLLEDQWRVNLAGAWYRAWPEGEIVVTSILICFKLRVEGKPHPSCLILFPDSADPVELHGFRLRLMLESHSLFGGKGEGHI
ncbi:protein YgfX [Endozoicomonas sp. ALB091]|uniref:protein YgfX n=1 Tax=Endozoicomonas sp. ALB091 TaxID=3403073 RepID=UPI003BB6EF06